MCEKQLHEHREQINKYRKLNIDLVLVHPFDNCPLMIAERIGAKVTKKETITITPINLRKSRG
jgi:hypothetical protein